MTSDVSARDIASRLTQAVAAGDIRVHMQPVVSLPSMRVSGCEALARWTDPELGSVPPDRFIRIAEESRLIVDLGRQVLRQACAIAATWQHLRGARWVSVNVSAVQLSEPDFAEDVARALTHSGLPPNRLILELTETAVLKDLEASAAQLTELRAMGVHVALDDFGVGQSPLTLLSRLPFTIVKIDRTFVANVHERAHDAVVSRIVIGAAHTLGLRVCAEGIEVREQAQQLVAMGCDYAQGYLIARPYDPSSGITPDDAVQDPSPIDPTAGAPIELGGTDELVVVTDPRRRITYASLGCLHVLGYRPTEVLGADIRDYIHPADRSLLPDASDSSRMDPTDILRHRVRHRDGSWRWLRTHIQVLTHEGSLREAVYTSKDITAEVRAEQDRAAAEADFKWAFEEAPIGMAISSFDGVLLRVNDAYAKMLGFTPDELAGVAIVDITHPEDLDQDEKNLDAINSRHETHQEVTKRYLHADGQPVVARVWVTAREPHDGGPGVVLAHIMSHDGTTP
jgi:PAS domain S-box-containing protein